MFILTAEPWPNAHVGFPLAAKHEVLGQRHVGHQPAAQPVARDVRQPRRAMLARAASGDRASRDPDAAARRGAQPRKGFDQLVLPVALDAGQPDDLARAHHERHASCRQHRRTLVPHLRLAGLTFVGIALFGWVTAALASLFVESGREKDARAQRDRMQAQMDEMAQQLGRIEMLLARGADGDNGEAQSRSPV